MSNSKNILPNYDNNYILNVLSSMSPADLCSEMKRLVDFHNTLLCDGDESSFLAEYVDCLLHLYQSEMSIRFFNLFYNAKCSDCEFEKWCVAWKYMSID